MSHCQCRPYLCPPRQWQGPTAPAPAQSGKVQGSGSRAMERRLQRVPQGHDVSGLLMDMQDNCT